MVRDRGGPLDGMLAEDVSRRPTNPRKRQEALSGCGLAETYQPPRAAAFPEDGAGERGSVLDPLVHDLPHLHRFLVEDALPHGRVQHLAVKLAHYASEIDNAYSGDSP